MSLSRKKLQEHCTSVNVTKKLGSADSVLGELGKGNSVNGVNYNLNSNYTKYLAQLCGRFFTFWKIFHRKFANIVAPPTNYETFSDL